MNRNGQISVRRVGGADGLEDVHHTSEMPRMSRVGLKAAFLR